MKIENLYPYFLESAGICTDTRKITKNCLFFCLSGDSFNGNTFAQEAIDKGALRVIGDDTALLPNSEKVIHCENSLHLLQELATFHRRQLGIPIIAITGSNGKTTTKELIYTVIAQNFRTIATKGNLNNHIGVPLTLLSLTSDTEIAIVEMGANHLKEIELLCSIALPDYGYITNFGKAHLEGFGSLEGVIHGKTELYRHLAAHNKLIFVNGNDEMQLKHSSGQYRFIFGDENPAAQTRLVDASNALIVQCNGVEIKSKLIGKYNFNNIAAAIAIGIYFDVPLEKIKNAIENYVPSNNRSQLLEKGSYKIILDAYNANPTSMMAALENFNQTQAHKKVLFLGDMFELGHTAAAEHQNIVSYLEKNAMGEVYLIGSNFFKTITTAQHIHKLETFEDLKRELAKKSFLESTILIKASRGMALERIVELL